MTEAQLKQTNENLIARRIAEDPQRAKAVAATLARLKPMETRRCDCGEEIILDNLSPWMREHATKCEKCAIAADFSEQVKAQESTNREAKWKEFCPVDYQGTILDRLPCGQEALRGVLMWKYGPRGLLLHGTTGRGKSRCAWLVLHAQHNDGKRVDYLNSQSLSFTLPGLYAKGADSVDTWLNHLCRVDVLLLDDCFKAVLNDRTEAFMFALLSSRTERHRPIIATLNDTSESLKARLTGDRADPMLRRLTEYCHLVNFG